MSYIKNSFPILQGKVNLTTGTISGGTILCVEDGTLTVTWKDDSTSSVDMVAGLAIDLTNAKSASIDSGTYHGA